MKIYTTDNKILTEKPQIQIGDKLYAVDDRQSTFNKLNEQLQKDSNNMEAIYKLVFGNKAAQEIMDMELSVLGTQNLLIYVFAAIKGCEFEEAQMFFRDNQ